VSENPYVDLWQFARKIAPVQTEKIADYWRLATAYPIDSSMGSANPEEREKARLDVLRDYPWLLQEQPTELPRLITDQVILNRLVWRTEVIHLLNQELPRMVKDRLLSGNYEITARRLNDQQVVTLSPRDLAGLDIDIQNRQFVGSAGCYGEIAIRKKIAEEQRLADSAQHIESPRSHLPPGEPSCTGRRRASPKRDRVQKRMEDDLRSGDPARDPRCMLTKQWPERYGEKLTTCREALTRACEALNLDPNDQSVCAQLRSIALDVGRQRPQNDK
jgi:hypothetical protein